MQYPLAETYAPEPLDEELVGSALAGESQALELLLRRHQGWIYNLALRLLSADADAEDATQEVLIKIVTHLSSFRGESAFRTWAYRIVVNHVRDRRRSKPEQVVHDFACYGAYLARAPDEDLGDASTMSAETRLLVEEAKVGCMLGMLLCLDREQRLVFVLGEIFEVKDGVGSEVLQLTRENFRQRLARARQQLYGFMAGKCGLVDGRNPCRCARKTRAFIKDGIVDPRRLQFARPHLDQRQADSRARGPVFESLVESGYAQLFREHPLVEPPDLVARLRDLVGDTKLRTLLELDDGTRGG